MTVIMTYWSRFIRLTGFTDNIISNNFASSLFLSDPKFMPQENMLNLPVEISLSNKPFSDICAGAQSLAFCDVRAI